MEWMICLDEGGNAEGPEFDGPKDEPVWSLYAAAPDLGPTVTGPHFGEWAMYRYGCGMNRDQAERMAADIGLSGAPIGR